MADDLTNRGPADRARVNINEDYEVQYWAKKWGVSPDALKNAVAKVGPSATAVEQHLKGSG